MIDSSNHIKQVTSTTGPFFSPQSGLAYERRWELRNLQKSPRLRGPGREGGPDSLICRVGSGAVWDVDRQEMLRLSPAYDHSLSLSLIPTRKQLTGRLFTAALRPVITMSKTNELHPSACQFAISGNQNLKY